ncbi:unnamed protein product [Arabis nemorensis]|uniref:Pentacotripeptide-repeat region of PRORP domain-containing protein n=1 Tax=Arabis nemorensis TaxID=586526 RepID=A0A565CDS2_9BRAS|nr:unnamed protein product [Arabis nemorensis]
MEKQQLVHLQRLFIQDSSQIQSAFLGVLSACSHCGFVDQGAGYFQAMSRIYGITPKRKPYACMLDLLGRNRRFAEAEKLMDEMPFEPDEIIWSCRGSSRTTL